MLKVEGKKVTELELLVKELKEINSDINFSPAETFYWSPTDKTVYYDSSNDTREGLWALLHESGHAILGHRQYYSDIELVQMEVEAWDSAKDLAAKLEIIIDENHAEDCIDSYRNWLHGRSLCPDCNLSSIQIDTKHYSCVFCQKKWQVTAERFCRPYRKTI
jgi:hypothetical protein